MMTDKESKIEEIIRDILFEIWWRYQKYRCLFACRSIIMRHIRAHQFSQNARLVMSILEELREQSKKTRKPIYRWMAHQIDPAKAFKAVEGLANQSHL